MNRANILVLGLLVTAGAATLFAQSSDEPRAGTEPLTGWAYLAEISLPDVRSGRVVDFVLPPAVFDKARADLGDLRLTDGGEREVPYALRVRHAQDKQEPLSAREFNKTTHPDRSAEVSLDLGEAAVEHNEVEVRTGGTDFRRRVTVDGSDDGKMWSTLLDKAYLIDFRVGEQHVERRRASYPVSRFRYVRVRVYPDTGKDDDEVTLQSLVVSRTTRDPGEYLTLPATLGSREAVPARGGPGSAWWVSWDGLQAPCERLSFDVADPDFARPFHVDVADPDARLRYLTGSEWRRRAGGEVRPLEVSFPEVTARRLRLVVTDNRNPPLQLTGAHFTAAARQVVFARSEKLTPPLRLYFGNPKAGPPHYDFAANLPPVLQPPPNRARLGEVEDNPIYQPVPKPWTERWPWLVYVVLGAASMALLSMLGLLAREELARHDGAAANQSAPQNPG